MKKCSVVSIWLLIGCFLVLCQIMIGGITRLTDSGLSITEWEVVKGTIPPMNEVEWTNTFEKYKLFAKKQYESIHKNMTLTEFKKIYFWEYFHRLWARMMGFIFIIPFIYFLIKKKINSNLLKRLGIVILLASIAAIFGWIMVASGLNNDKRTWVNAYNLLIHLLIATALFSYLLYTYFIYSKSTSKSSVKFYKMNLLQFIGIIIIIQLAFGALMAGMKAGMILPYSFLIPKYSLISELFKLNSNLSITSMYDYEPNPMIKVLIQIVHRVMAYLILTLSIVFLYFNRVKLFHTASLWVFISAIFLQIILGIITVSLCIGKVPILFGVLHQTAAFILLASYLWVLFIAKKEI